MRLCTSGVPRPIKVGFVQGHPASRQAPAKKAPFHPRPHWGKLFTFSPTQLQSSYDRLPAFVEFSRKYDPQGKFQNDFLRTYVFGAVS